MIKLRKYRAQTKDGASILIEYEAGEDIMPAHDANGKEFKAYVSCFTIKKTTVCYSIVNTELLAQSPEPEKLQLQEDFARLEHEDVDLSTLQEIGLQ